jgi:hypothetical protein
MALFLVSLTFQGARGVLQETTVPSTASPIPRRFCAAQGISAQAGLRTRSLQTETLAISAQLGSSALPGHRTQWNVHQGRTTRSLEEPTCRHASSVLPGVPAQRLGSLVTTHRARQASTALVETQTQQIRCTSAQLEAFAPLPRLGRNYAHLATGR